MKDLLNMLGTWIIILFGAYVISWEVGVRLLSDIYPPDIINFNRERNGGNVGIITAVNGTDATKMLQGTVRNVLLWGIFSMLWSIQSKLYYITKKQKNH